MENTALKRMVDPKHVAAAVVFLLEAGDSITGGARSQCGLCALSDVRYPEQNVRYALACRWASASGTTS